MSVSGSIHSIFADESIDDQFTMMECPGEIIDGQCLSNLIPYHLARDSKYDIHIQIIVRNVEGQLVSITETTGGIILDHKLTDNMFDTMLGEKEVITVNDVKYQKVEFGDSFTPVEFYEGIEPICTALSFNCGYTGGLWIVQTDMPLSELGIISANVFQIRSNQVILEKDDIITTNWTGLRFMY